MSTRMPPQWVDGEMDVKVELQALGLCVSVFYLRGNIVCPQFKEYFVVSIIKRAKEVFLEKSELKNSELGENKMSSTSNNNLLVFMIILFAYHIMIIHRQ